MLKYIKSFYNFLMKLKQYHATHILIIPSALFFIISYKWVLCINIQSLNSIDGSTGLDSLIIFIIHLTIVCCTIFVALFVEIITLTLYFVKKKKIYVKSKFLLNNKIYNIIYILTLSNYIILILSFTIEFPISAYDYSFLMYLFPWIYLLPK